MIGQYNPCTLLGSGRFGETWECEHGETRARAITKLLHRDVSALPQIRRFFDDVQALERVTTSGAAKVLASGMFGDRAFVTRELVIGQSLERRIALEPPTLAEAASVGHQIAITLGAVHRIGVAHHALRPSNVIVSRGAERVVTVDFGLAALVAARLDHALPGGIAPEQWAGVPVPASDVYGLGCLVFHAIAGRPLFVSATPGGVREHHLNTPAPSLAAFQPDVPPAIERLVATMLHKDPTRRPPLATVAAQLALLAGADYSFAATMRS